MMKKHILLFVLSLLPLVASAFTGKAEVNGIWYNIVTKGQNAEVISSNTGMYTGNIDIPNSIEYDGVTCYVTSISNEAFYGCSGLMSVIIPNSVTSIGEGAFSGCSGLTSVTIPNSVTSIGEGAFSGCSGLTSVTIPNSVTSIGIFAFAECSGLTSVHISDLEAWCKITFKGHPFDNAHHLFLNGEEIKDLVIPNSVTSIGYCAFYGCSGLTSVTIPNSVTSIGNEAFYGCSGLTSVTIPNSVTSIGEGAFYKCSKLTSVTIPNSVTSIGGYAFYKCSKLTTISIGKGVQSIFSGAFANCPELTDVFCYAENIPYNTHYNTFEGSYIEYATLHVPAALVNAYRQTAPWSGFKNILALNTGVAQIPAQAVLIMSEGGMLNVEGAEDGTRVSVYSVNGTMAGEAVSHNGSARIGTNLQPGSVAIVKIGQKSIKVVVR